MFQKASSSSELKLKQVHTTDVADLIALIGEQDDLPLFLAGLMPTLRSPPAQEPSSGSSGPKRDFARGNRSIFSKLIVPDTASPAVPRSARWQLGSQGFHARPLRRIGMNGSAPCARISLSPCLLEVNSTARMPPVAVPIAKCTSHHSRLHVALCLR